MQAMSAARTRTLKIVSMVLYVLVACVFVLPILYMFVSSFKTDTQIVSDMSTVKAFLPTGELSFSNYSTIMVEGQFWRFFKNSALIAVLNVGIEIVVNAMIGYALGMLAFKGKGLIISLVIALAVVPTESVIINKFIVVNSMGLMNTIWGLAIPSAGYPMFIFLFYNHFKGMPMELVEAGILDYLMDCFVRAVIHYDVDDSALNSIDRRLVYFISSNYKDAYHYHARGKSESEKLYLRLLLVTDFICGMTDSYAKRLYQELKAIL